ncbi:type VII secretion protein EsaA [Oceanobacillus senegalensis]|uniref:type VII secretion protein EsaA n=1 Tax=Oceanobacillus senegalensis TaxID=1936063 RepID=UPI000A30DE2B|nr:type VII secretion protein EsaA [Oceanobacillus senegalensis]
MNEEKKFPIGIILKLLVVLALPLLLFRYVDVQPATGGTSGFSQGNQTTVKDIAVVNEDLGYQLEEKKVSFGQDIAMLLNDQIKQDDYEWTVVNRSTAEQGLSNQTYNAVMYVPSDFSENVLTFTEENPKKAAVNYVVQPNLEAKDRENVHRIMANAKNIINQEMSMNYWSYVSQEINHLKEQFDTILEKEIEFQEEMSSFYASESLAEKINQHKNNLEGILSSTEQANEISTNGSSSMEEVEAEINTFVKALEDYKETQQQQKGLLDEFQLENQEAIQTGVERYQEALALSTNLTKEQIQGFQTPVYFQQEVIQKDIQGFQKSYQNVFDQLLEAKYGSTDENGEHLKNGFVHWQENGETEIRSQLLKMNEVLLQTYHDALIEETKTDIYRIANKIHDIEPSEEDDHPSLPEEQTVDVDELTDHVKELSTSIYSLKNVVSDTETTVNQESPSNNEKKPTNEEKSITENNPSDSNSTDENTEIEKEGSNELNEAESTPESAENETVVAQPTEEKQEESSKPESESDDKEQLEETSNPESNVEQSKKPTNPNWSDVLEDLDQLEETVNDLPDTESQKEYAEELQNAYDKLSNIEDQIFESVVERIVTTQVSIIDSKSLSPREKEALTNHFLDAKRIEDKDVALLMDYFKELTALDQALDRRDSINLVLVRKLLADDEMQSEINDLLDINTPYTKELQDMFTVLLDDGEDIGEMTLLEQRFNKLVKDTNEFLEEYNSQILEEQNKILKHIDLLTSTASQITEQLQVVNAETFEWEESSSVEYLDGQLVVNVQQISASSLEQLADLTSSLEESQTNITNATEDLQAQVNRVQQESENLNDRWSTNVASTSMIREDIYEILDNTLIDGQENPVVYNHLASPVQVAGQMNGKVLSQTEERVPPVVLFVIILVSGLLIGFISHYYRNVSYLIQGALFGLMNLAVGLIISIYGLNMYGLDNAQAIQWSIFTILLLFVCSNVVRAGLFIGPFIGWMVSIATIMFFISPLLNIVLPEFNFANPVSNAYLSIQYGLDTPVILTMVILIGIVLLLSVFIYMLQNIRNKAVVDEHDEKAS